MAYRNQWIENNDHQVFYKDQYLGQNNTAGIG